MACDKLGGLACEVSHLTWSEVKWLIYEIKKVFGEEIE